MTSAIQLLPMTGLPDVTPGDDIAVLLLEALAVTGDVLRDGDGERL